MTPGTKHSRRFVIKDCALIQIATGARAQNVRELRDRNRLKEMGRKAKQLVRENFLITRLLRGHLTLMVGLTQEAADRLELG